ncbi:ImmA/IrrE family metallo-endopeptidase [Agromyces badenianii]|uniref:ImmA/IrrE family metallo-endopeptidase n=1 Tax=Agromyces badenianii TaxID=2080742 RepID=UPI000D59602D|nr:ImmA/IrrE family metallo-endopeptidase [Agromyces badenianii]PWC05427.1 XRE family transcriptional regulator [Agromyces badenianii]
MSSVVLASPLSNSAIAEYAERVGAFHNIYDIDGRADLHELVRLLGGRVDVSSSFFADEALTVRAAGDFTVHLPPMTSDRRDRFTIAHELGHYFLHYLQPEETGERGFGRGSQSRAETQANYFAASLLMPSEVFKNSFRKCGGDLWTLADDFGVSHRAAEVRAQVLGL